MMDGLIDHIDVPIGTVITREGDHGYYFYIVERGVADVTVDGHFVSHLRRGDAFGSTEGPERNRSTVIAATNAKVLCVSCRNLTAFASIGL
jgi:CRP-like cAMP-binding protein